MIRKNDKITQVLSINDPQWKYYLCETLWMFLVELHFANELQWSEVLEVWVTD